MHIDPDQLDFHPSGGGWERAVLVLGKGDTAWNPASTKHVIYGPARVTYVRAPDGGVDATAAPR